MKTSIPGHIYCTHPNATPEDFAFATYDMSAHWPKVATYTIEAEIPDGFDARPDFIKALEAEKEKLQKEFADKVMRINEQISKMLCISNGLSDQTNDIIADIRGADGVPF